LQPTVRHRLLLVSAAVLFSTGGAAFKAASLTGWQVASFRSLVAALALLAIIPDTRRGWNWRMTPVALAYAITLVFFALANRLTTSANAIILQSTAPLYLLLLGPWLLHEPIRRRDLYFVAGVALGMGLFFAGRDASVATAPDPPLGNALALASGITYAFMLAGLRWMGKHHGDSALTTVAAGNLMAFAIALPMALPILRVTAWDVLVVLYLGVIQVGLAYWCLTRGMRYVPVLEATTMLQAEPALNPVWTWLVHHEVPNTWAIAGGLLIISATLVNTWGQKRVK
jgi:drug/metabolite transporter, DME family